MRHYPPTDLLSRRLRAKIKIKLRKSSSVRYSSYICTAPLQQPKQSRVRNQMTPVGQTEQRGFQSRWNCPSVWVASQNTIEVVIVQLVSSDTQNCEVRTLGFGSRDSQITRPKAYCQNFSGEQFQIYEDPPGTMPGISTSTNTYSMALIISIS